MGKKGGLPPEFEGLSTVGYENILAVPGLEEAMKAHALPDDMEEWTPDYFLQFFEKFNQAEKERVFKAQEALDVARGTNRY